MTKIDRDRRAFVERILEGDGTLGREQRAAAFAGEGLGEPLKTLADKVARASHSVTDDDVARARAAGLGEDQVFELVVCAAAGQATRKHEAALAVLAAVSGER